MIFIIQFCKKLTDTPESRNFFVISMSPCLDLTPSLANPSENKNILDNLVLLSLSCLFFFNKSNAVIIPAEIFVHPEAVTLFTLSTLRGVIPLFG